MRWFEIDNIDQVDTPALLVYPDRITQNLKEAIRLRGDVSLLRPHVKTHKMSEVCEMMMDLGIQKFKCATIAEAEMLAKAGAPDILIAYQVMGPKLGRLARLRKTFPKTNFSVLVDNEGTAMEQAAFFDSNPLEVFLDIDVGQHRTGIAPSDALNLFGKCLGLTGIDPRGLHVYDGHIRDREFSVRKERCDRAFATADELKTEIEKRFNTRLKMVIGGSPSFSVHCTRKEVECSPGTFVLWDYGYQSLLSEQAFQVAAVIATRVISKMDKGLICLDLGHKSIASENPFPRIFFFDYPKAKQIGHSEEHLVLDVGDHSDLSVGSVFYGIPLHICPTVALYDSVRVVRNQSAVDTWKVVARDRKISI